MSIDLSGLPQNVTVAVGGRFVMPLPSYSGSGNAWSATPLAGSEVAQVRVEPMEAPARPDSPRDGAAEPPALTLVTEQAIVSGLARGEARWRLVLSRSFDPPAPTATHDFQVIVVSAP